MTDRPLTFGKNELILQKEGSTHIQPISSVISVALLHKQVDFVILYFLKCMQYTHECLNLEKSRYDWGKKNVDFLNKILSRPVFQNLVFP